MKLHISTLFYLDRKRSNYIFCPFLLGQIKDMIFFKGDFQTWKASFLGKESPNLDGQEIRNFVAQDS